jgi:hypothetical protein
MLRKALSQGLLLITGLAGTLAASAGNLLGDGPSLVAGAPFSGVVEVQSVTAFADGNRIVRSNSMRYFRDGQGRTRIERQGLTLEGSLMPAGPTIVINDPVSGQRVDLLPKLKIANEFKFRGGVVSPAVAVAAVSESTPPFALLGLGMALGASQYTEASTSTTSLGQKDINGLTTTGSRIVRTIPAGVLGNEKPINVTIEEWVSPDLGMTVQFTETSSVGGSVTFNLGQVVRAEPDPTLFTVPTDYKVRNIGLPNVFPSSGAEEPATMTGTATSSGTASSRP